MGQQVWCRSISAKWTLTILAALATASFPGVLGGADTSGFTLTRYVDTVDTLCLAPKNFGGMQTRYKRRRGRDWAVPTASLDDANFFLIGSNATLTAATCVGNLDLQLYTAGVFTALSALPGALATTGYQVTTWRPAAGVASPVDMEVVNETPRPFKVAGVSSAINLPAVTPLAIQSSDYTNVTVAPNWTGNLSRSDVTLSWATLPIVEAYFLQQATATSMYNSAWGTSPRAAVLVSETVSSTGQVKWVATYLYYYWSSTSQALKFEVFESTFYQPPPTPMTSASGRKLLAYPPPPPPDESSYIDSASVGACAGGYCYPRSPVPSWCVRGAAAYPRCLYVCVCP
eukprot:jgi/Mesen1/1983/ME000147S01079